jgi:hypothetical protein
MASLHLDNGFMEAVIMDKTDRPTFMGYNKKVPDRRQIWVQYEFEYKYSIKYP